MAKVKVYNLNAEEAVTKTLKNDVFGLEYNESLINEYIVVDTANRRP